MINDTAGTDEPQTQAQEPVQSMSEYIDEVVQDTWAEPEYPTEEPIMVSLYESSTTSFEDTSATPVAATRIGMDGITISTGNAFVDVGLGISAIFITVAGVLWIRGHMQIYFEKKRYIG